MENKESLFVDSKHSCSLKIAAGDLSVGGLSKFPDQAAHLLHSQSVCSRVKTFLKASDKWFLQFLEQGGIDVG